MTEGPGPRALREFVDALESDDDINRDVGRAIAHLHREGRLTASAIVAALRDIRSQEDQHGATAED